MERRFRLRLGELLDDAQVLPGLLRGVLPRLEAFVAPFAAALDAPEQRTHSQLYVCGLLSDLKSKDVESIAYLHNRDRQGLQKFIGQLPWDHQPLLTELVRQVADQLGDHLKAQEYYAAALKIVPNQPQVLSNLGLSYALSKQLPLAETTLQQAVAQPGSDIRVRQNLALVLALEGKFSTAQEISERDLPPIEGSELGHFSQERAGDDGAYAGDAPQEIFVMPPGR